MSSGVTGGVDKLRINPGPLKVVAERGSVGAMVEALRGRSRADRLRVWVALGGAPDDFSEAQSGSKERA